MADLVPEFKARETQLQLAWMQREKPMVITDFHPELHIKQPVETLPDIYYIVLDGYARNDTLAEYYGLDNSGFTDSLQQQGFYVADRSYSNYPVTRWSLTSSLNMRYIHKEDQRGNETSYLFSLLRNNEVGRILKAQGYQYVHFNTHWPGTYRCDLADQCYDT